MIRLACRPSLGDAAVAALLQELATFPKPGLVSYVDNGSHEDMTAGHFERSAHALRPCYARMARAGARSAGFDTLRRLAVEAEVAMLRATGGVNTHRGAIFCLGLLSAAAGLRAATGSPKPLGALVRERWGADIARHRRDPASHGSTVERRHGAGGAQAEAAAGFPSVYGIALPAYRRGGSVQAFFALLAAVDDTNLLHRGGVEGLRFAQTAAREFLEGKMSAAAVHHAFVARGLSPGGCADLLAACLYVAAVEG